VKPAAVAGRTMSVAHRITGYDKRTQFLAVEYGILDPLIPKAAAIENIPSEDSDAIGAYPLAADQAVSIARLANTSIDFDRYDWFFEPFAEPDAGSLS
jgi:hypothetical protein